MISRTMWGFRVRRVCAALVTSGCGGAAPTAPSKAPPGLQLVGVWAGKKRRTGFEDGECLEPLFEALVGVPMQFTPVPRRPERR